MPEMVKFLKYEQLKSVAIQIHPASYKAITNSPYHAILLQEWVSQTLV